MTHPFKSWQSYRYFSHRVRTAARFVRTSEDEDFLQSVLATSASRIVEINELRTYCRAQLGFRWAKREIAEGEYDEFPDAYLPERMKPRNEYAKEGRANPRGIAYLYLATNKETAMAEVRPWLGSYISLGYFKTQRPLRLIDCSRFHAKGFVWHEAEPSDEEKEKAVWAAIDRAFSEPVSAGDDSVDYVPTQIIAELFKSFGYDGLAYKSALNEVGFNIVLYDLAAANLVSCGLHQCKKIDFEFVQSDNPYFVREAAG